MASAGKVKRELEKINFTKIEATLQRVFQIRFPYYESIYKIDKHVIKVVNKIMNCRTARLGGFKYKCEICGDEVIAYNSCHNRSCPLCNNIPREEWLLNQQERLLETEYVHIVFKLPEEVNKYLLSNKTKIINLFFEKVKKILQNKTKNLIGGIIIQYHSEGSTLTLHPHLHCLVILGGLNEEKKEWKKVELREFNRKKLMIELKESFLNGLKFLHKKGKLKNPKAMNNCKVILDIEDLKRKEFDVYIVEKYKNMGEAVLKYFSKSVRGGSISNDRILKVTESTVRFEYSNSQTNGEVKVMELAIDEFLKRVLLHIPASRQKLIRYYGLFSTSKKKELELSKKLLEEKEVKLESKEVLKGNQEIKEKRKIYCKKCGIEMKKVEKIEPVKKVSKERQREEWVQLPLKNDERISCAFG